MIVDSWPDLFFLSFFFFFFLQVAQKLPESPEKEKFLAIMKEPAPASPEPVRKAHDKAIFQLMTMFIVLGCFVTCSSRFTFDSTSANSGTPSVSLIKTFPLCS